MSDFFKFTDDISDEMLAAYIDGNATESESVLIEKSLKKDSLLSEVFDIVHDEQFFKEDFGWDEVVNNSDDDIGFLTDFPGAGDDVEVEENESINNKIMEHMKYNFSLFNREEANNSISELSSGAKAAKQLFGEEGNGKTVATRLYSALRKWKVRPSS